MRIIGGRHRGRELASPKGKQTRPTSGQLREALFNIVDPTDMRVWDLYAGSGAVGLEALSRGAKSVRFVETHSLALHALHENIERLGEGDRCRVLRSIPDEPVDLIFADPPYNHNVDELLAKLADRAAPIFLEISSKSPEPNIPEPLELIRSRRYGAARLLELRPR